MIQKPFAVQLKHFCSVKGCEVVTAVDGFEALSKIAESNPDIVFVDIMMPRLRWLPNVCLN